MADQLYYSLFTDAGLTMITDAIRNGKKLGITHMAFGDGNGSLPVPTKAFTKLVKEVYRMPLNSLSPDPKNANWLRAEAVIASAIGGFNIRELGLYAGETLVAYSNYPPTYKPSPSDGTARIMTFRMVLQIDNTANFELVIDPDVVMATIGYVDDSLKTLTILYDSIELLKADLRLQAGQFVYVKSFIAGGSKESGAMYEISSTQLDYSIALQNNLYANFADVFDIRKFGIVDNPTLRQDNNLIRAMAYADVHCYEIDFHNFNIVAPKVDCGAYDFYPTRGLWFEKAHKIKNLKIYHDKTQRLNTGDCLLIFCPRNNPSIETWVSFENVVLDAWNTNYQPFTENYLGTYDGMRHGIFCHPRSKSRGGQIEAWKDETNFSFNFENINFLSPAYSYNITTSAVCAKNTIIDRVLGWYAGLGINYQSFDLIAQNIQLNRRDDYIESGRVMVGTIIHQEAELAGLERDFKRVYLENITGYSFTNNSQDLCAYKISPLGTRQSLALLEAINVDGQIVCKSKIHTINEFKRLGGKSVTNVFYNTTVIKATLDGFPIENTPYSNFGSVASILVGTTNITELIIKNSKINVPICSDEWSGKIDSLTIDTASISGVGQYKMILKGGLVNEINLKNITTSSTNLLQCDFNILNIENITINPAVDVINIRNFIYQTDQGKAQINASNFKFKASQEVYSTTFLGNADIKINGGEAQLANITATGGATMRLANIDSPLFTKSIDISNQSVPASGRLSFNQGNVLLPDMKSYSVCLQIDNPNLKIEHYIGGGMLYIDIVNKTSNAINTSNNALVVRQVI